MSYVDHSNTDWTPWPRLGRLPHRVQVAVGVAGIISAAAVLFKVREYMSPPLPRTMSKEWQDATKKMNEAKDREAAGPVVINPISRMMEKK